MDNNLINADVRMLAHSILGPKLRWLAPTGSRYICEPPPKDTDEDWILLTWEDPTSEMVEGGFSQDGSPGFYTGNDNGGFRSWRNGDLNLVTTQDEDFYKRFVSATEIAKRLNLTEKADRIALFQCCLYGVADHHLEKSDG